MPELALEMLSGTPPRASSSLWGEACPRASGSGSHGAHVQLMSRPGVCLVTVLIKRNAVQHAKSIAEKPAEEMSGAATKLHPISGRTALRQQL